MKRLLMLLPFTSALFSCVSVEIEPQIAVPQPVEVEVLSVVSQFHPKTKSAVDTDEDQVYDVNLYVFDNTGAAVLSRFENSFSRSQTISLLASVEYTVCLLANWGEQIDFPSLSSLENFQLGPGQFCRNGHMVMSAKNRVIPVGGETRVYLDLRRVVAKVSLAMDSSALGRVEVQSARICQANSRILPFAENSSAATVGNGDYASASDLQMLTDGGSVVFYVPENTKGTILPGNTDPWNKVPDSIGSAAGLCTYLELQCRIYDEKTLYCGSVQYRFYLGNDNCSNFDVRRNTDYRITLVLTENLDMVSWKIDADVSLATEGHGSGEIGMGLHDSVSSLYVGEIFSYEIEADDALLGYFGGDLSGASLVVCDGLGVETGSVSFSALTRNSGKWTSRGTCRAATISDESIWIVDRARMLKVQKLESGVRIKLPSLVCTSSAPEAGGSVNESKSLALSVNGSSISRTVCMVDSERRNLAGRWFDNSVFSGTSIALTFDSGFESLSDCVRITSQRSLKGAANFATLSCSAVYSGEPVQVGMRLCDGVGLSEAGVHVTIREPSRNLSSSFPVSLRVRPVSLDYDCITGIATVSNPSKLPLMLQSCDFAWLGHTGRSTAMLSAGKGVEEEYTCGGDTYTAVRHDCVNSNGQCFAYSDGVAMVITDGELDLSYSMVDFRTAFAGLSNDSASFALFDIAMVGTSGRIPFPQGMISTSTQAFHQGAGASGYHGGVVLFTDGHYIAGSEGVSPGSTGAVAYSCEGLACIYSPRLLSSIGVVPATLGESSTTSAIAQHQGSTESLDFTLNGGLPTAFEITYGQIAAVRTMPNGYSDSPFTVMRYKWKSPQISTILLSSANPGNNRFSYTFAMESNVRDIVGNYGSSKFTSSNFVLDDSLSKTFVYNLNPGETASIPVLSFIDNRVFTMYEEDSASALRANPTYPHRYHPGDCSITGYAHTLSDDHLYLCDFTPMFTAEMSYFNSMYDGFYSWMVRDLSAPMFPTLADIYSAGSNCDRYTTWYYKNRGDGFADSSEQTIRSGMCIRIVR